MYCIYYFSVFFLEIGEEFIKIIYVKGWEKIIETLPAGFVISKHLCLNLLKQNSSRKFDLSKLR